MPNLCVGIEGTVARDNADNHRFRIVAAAAVSTRLPLLARTGSRAGVTA